MAGRRLPQPSKGMLLLLALALATPVAELVILGLTGNDLFGARNLNTSSAGLALAIGAILAAAGPRFGTVCAVVVLAGFSIGAARTTRPSSGAIPFGQAADYISGKDEPGDVVVDVVSAAITPVPLTPLQIYLDQPPPQRLLFFPVGEPPFLPFKSTPPPPSPLLKQAFREARGHRVFLVGSDVDLRTAGSELPAGVEQVGDATQVQVRLPKGTHVIEQAELLGVRPLNIFVIEVDPARPGSP